jgi:hypothetical protein
MFKKPFKVASHNSLSGKDRKKLAADLKKFLDPDAVAALLENNDPDVVINKISGSKMVLYSIDNVPYFIDATGKGVYFPTCNSIVIEINK